MSRVNRLLLSALPLLPDLLARRLLRGRHSFDLRHGTETGGLMYAPDLATGHANDRFNEGYYATAPSVFRGLISRWEMTLAGAPEPGSPRTGLRPWGGVPALGEAEGFPPLETWEGANRSPLSRYEFVDLGCGKGRALLLASELPFRRVTGVELHPDLCAAARRNVERWLRSGRARTEIEVMCCDVLNVPLPEGPAVLFLFNAFGVEVMRPLLERLAEAARTRTAPTDLLYVHPDWAALVERTPDVEVLFDGDIAFSREDRLADVFGVNADRCGVYRLRAPGAMQS